MNDYSQFYEDALESPIRWNGNEGKTNCPFHDDRNPSLSVNRDNGTFHCFGCGASGSAQAFAKRLGLHVPRMEWKNNQDTKAVNIRRGKYREHEREHVYTDADGNPVHLIGIDGSGKNKKVYQYHWQDGKWYMGGPKTKIPYRLPDVIRAVQAQETVFVVEGEKDADTLHEHGLTATTNPCGAGSWPKHQEFNQPFKDATIVILPDNDEPGREHADKVAALLRILAKTIKIVPLPGLTESGDVSDWLASGRTIDELKRIVDEAPVEQIAPKEQEPTMDPETFFENGRFQPVLLGRKLLDLMPSCVNGSDFYTYDGGVYQVRGDAKLRKKALDLLGSKYRQAFVNETMDWIRTKLFGEPVQAFNEVDDYINVQNGLLNWRTGELLPHTPDRYSSIQIPVTYNPNAKCPEVKKFFSEIVPVDVVPTLFELFGYCLLPTNRFQKAFMLHGTGANGKSTLLKLLEQFVGLSNVSNVPLHQLERDKFKVVQLKGKLINVFADISHKGLDTSSTFKALTGEDRINAEYKGKDGFDFRPFARLIFSANVPPTSSDVSNGFFRRWIVIPFPYSFEGRQDPHLLDRLTSTEELSGLLNLALEALRRLDQQKGFTTGPSLEKALTKYMQEADNIAGFLVECCKIDVNETYPRKEFYHKYVEWCQENGVKSTTKKKFNQRLLEKVPNLSTGRKYLGPELWLGITYVAS